MAISKRLRFEVLRRDNHTCQYCGESAPNVTLHVDHVKPKALGGTDGPENLVTACKDCNTGKASTILGSEHAQEIAKRNVDWEVKAQRLAAQIRGTFERDALYLQDFEAEWEEYARCAGEPAVWPAGYQASIYKWAGMGYPQEALETAIGSAYGAKKVHPEDRFTYLAGIVWRQIKEAMVELEEVDEVQLYTEDDNIQAWQQGYASAESVFSENFHVYMARINPLSFVVDKLSSKAIESMRWIPDGQDSKH